MNVELKHLIEVVKASELPVSMVVHRFFKTDGRYYVIRKEFNKMSVKQRNAFCKKLSSVRK